DLLAGISHTKHGNHIASQHRKKQSFLGSRLAGYVVSALHPSSLSFIRSMTPLERHAELVYAESLFEKALLGIVYSGDWLAFIKEALNMRTTITVYRQLGHYLDAVDNEALSKGDPYDLSIDTHFRSGVYLGVGMSHIILSLMPGKLQTLVELFGYKGDRQLGLELLMKAGGWSKDNDGPSIDAEQEGVRRSICDMALLIFHLVLSSFTFSGVDIPLAQKILDWNLARYPSGVFFLFGAGRISLCRSQPRRAIDYYKQAMASQTQYRNLHHVSYWEMAIAHLALGEVGESLECWRELEREATWSKAIYTFGMAVCMVECAKSEEERREAGKVMARVPGLRQKIAGKSIPLEKFVARKARKYAAQGGRLMLPALELGYLFLTIAHAPRGVIATKMLPDVKRELAKLEGGAIGGGENEKGEKRDKEENGYWDDYCLVKFLEGVCLRYLAYPDPDAVIDSEDPDNAAATVHDDGSPVRLLTKEAAEKQSGEAFRFVFEHGPKIELDHHLVYHAHYEYGRLLACQGKSGEAKEQFELVISGRTLEVGPSGRKVRYSMENALHMRTHAAHEALLANPNKAL
ncbi:hypothetical protein AMATHDRAFT_157688, partial [Amanita thiersii Skay4041]